jgi:phosphoenolpyruvate---glycerone phosphotransferase subunit DhaL
MADYKITQKDLVDILQKTAVALKQHIEELRDLDAALGDGDLGVTIELGANAMLAYLASQNETDTGRMLSRMGMDINKVNPSTFGTLLATAFMGAGKAVPDQSELTPDDFLAMANGAVEAIKKRGKAEVGDKTMLDALVPAVEAYKTEFTRDNDIARALKRAIEASHKGMEATASMKAKFGRVSWRPDGGVGLKDGGAAAMYFLVSAFTSNLIEILEKR